MPTALAADAGLSPSTTHVLTLEQPLRLQSGRSLPRVQVAYEAYGQLNAQRSNAVLVCHALSGDAHAAGVDSRGLEGWWFDFIGPGKPIDTDRLFVLCSNVIGGCKGSTGPSDLDPATGRPYGRTFPVITIADMVEAQRRLVDALGIDRLLAVVGGSMGGMQVLEWATRHPGRLRAAIPIATTSRLGPQAIAFNAVGRNAIVSDAAFADGQYYAASGGDGVGPARGLAIARMVGHITYLSPESMHAKFGRALRDRDALGYDLASEFSVETYLDHQGTKFVERFDANSYLYITKAMDYFDLSGLPASSQRLGQGDARPDRHHAALRDAVRRATARFLVVSFSSDWLFPPAQSRELADALTAAGKDVSHCDIRSPFGHDAFLLEPEALGRLVRGFLDCVGEEAGIPRAPTPGLTRSQSLGALPPQPARIDHDTIVELVEPGWRVLDIGCGDGELMARLANERDAQVSGLELEQELVIRCVERGLTVRMGDATQGMPQFADGQFDAVVLSQTLQATRQPLAVLREMLRIGRRAIVSFPNFANWRVRLQLALLGQSPRTRSLPYEWHESPNISFFSLLDFEQLCRKLGARVERAIPLVGWSRAEVRWWPNLRAEEAVYVISR